jgi:hypothetical protein
MILDALGWGTVFAPILLRNFFTTSAGSSPVEVAPATINAIVAMHAGHIVPPLSLASRPGRREIDMPSQK